VPRLRIGVAIQRIEQHGSLLTSKKIRLPQWPRLFLRSYWFPEILPRFILFDQI
jgi:hypothetical protein